MQKLWGRIHFPNLSNCYSLVPCGYKPQVAVSLLAESLGSFSTPKICFQIPSLIYFYLCNEPTSCQVPFNLQVSLTSSFAMNQRKLSAFERLLQLDQSDLMNSLIYIYKITIIYHYNTFIILVSHYIPGDHLKMIYPTRHFEEAFSSSLFFLGPYPLVFFFSLYFILY